MASKKPVIHGRDHLPGGADPIPASLFTAFSGEEHFSYPSTLLAGEVNLIIPWTTFDGAASIDLTTPTHAMATTRGVYAAMVAVTIFLPAVEPAGDGVDLSIAAVQLTGPAWPPGVPVPVNASFVNTSNNSDVIAASGSTVAILQPNDYFIAEISNRLTYDVNVAASLSVVKIL